MSTIYLVANGDMRTSANHGKDFWQTDFDAESGFWEVTYNVPVEESANASHQRDLRFHVSGID